MTEARVVVITGAFGALGSAVAARAAAAGCRLALIDRADAPSEPGWEEATRALVLGGVDLTEPAEATRMRDVIVARFGGLDVLLNVAGAFRWELFEGGGANTFAEMFRLNVQTAANASRALIPDLRRSGAGRIVNVGAWGALNAGAGMGAYAAAKAGVHQLTHALAAELRGSGVTVNAVLPSIIDTPANRAEMPDADASTWVAPDALAAVMLFLASEGAQAVHGTLIPVTGSR